MRVAEVVQRELRDVELGDLAVEDLTERVRVDP